MLWGERRGNRTIVAPIERWSAPMPRQLNDLSRSLVALEQDATLIAVIEMGQSSWLVAGIVPGIERQPLKKLAPDQHALLHFCVVGRRKPMRPARSSSGSLWPMRLAATASGWRAGCAPVRSRPM